MGKVSYGSSDLLHSTRVNEVEGPNFLKNGGVTYVTEQ